VESKEFYIYILAILLILVGTTLGLIGSIFFNIKVFSMLSIFSIYLIILGILFFYNRANRKLFRIAEVINISKKKNIDKIVTTLLENLFIKMNIKYNKSRKGIFKIMDKENNKIIIYSSFVQNTELNKYSITIDRNKKCDENFVNVIKEKIVTELLNKKLISTIDNGQA
jgi:hypothetical protein